MQRSVHVGGVEAPGGDGRDAVEEEVDEAEAASSDRRQRGHTPPSLHAHKLFVIMKGRKK